MYGSGGVSGGAVRGGRRAALADHQRLAHEDQRLQRRQVRDVRVLAERGVDALQQVGRGHPVRVTLWKMGRKLRHQLIPRLFVIITWKLFVIIKYQVIRVNEDAKMAYHLSLYRLP